MLMNIVKCTAIAAAVAAALSSGGVQAQSYITSAGGTPVRNGEGACWRTAYWTPDSASEECDPQFFEKTAAAGQAQSVAASQASGAPHPEVKLVPVTYTTEVLFAFNDDSLTGDSLKQLDELGKRLVTMEVKKVVAVGHADGIGSSHYNQLLSARRLWVVRDYLAKQGVTTEQMVLEAKGNREPVTAGICDSMGLDKRLDPKLIACLQPDRRVKIEVIGEAKAFD